MNRSLLKFVVCALSVLVACQSTDEPLGDEIAYAWVASSISPGEEITVYKLKKGEAGQLYFSGWTVEETSIFGELVNGQWEILAQADEQIFGDFTVFQDTVYYSTSLSIVKTKGTYATTLLNTVTHCSLEVFEGKLFIAGIHLPFDGQEYSLLSYDASKTFSPVYQGGSHSTMKIINQKLFVAGNPVIIYSDGFVQETTYNKSFLNVDNEESFYGFQSSDANHIDITKFQNQRLEKIGNTLVTNTLLNRLEFNGGSLILTGHDPNDDTSNSFFLSTRGSWNSIDTDFLIYDLIKFDNKILAGSTGKIMELSSQ